VGLGTLPPSALRLAAGHVAVYTSSTHVSFLNLHEMNKLVERSGQRNRNMSIETHDELRRDFESLLKYDVLVCLHILNACLLVLLSNDL